MFAPDVLGQTGSIIEQISSLKISNIPIGKQFVGLLNSGKDKSSIDAADRSIDIPYVSKLSYSEKFSITTVVFSKSVQFWKFVQPNFSSPSMIYEHKLGGNTSVQDIIVISVDPFLQFVTATKSEGEEYTLSLTSVGSVADDIIKAYDGVCSRMVCNKNIIVVAQTSGTIRIHSSTTLQVLSEVQSLEGAIQT